MRHWKTWMGGAAAAALLAAAPGLAETALEPNQPAGDARNPGQRMDQPARPAQPADPARPAEPARPDVGARGDANAHQNENARSAMSGDEYVVEEGDTLAEIAADKLGSAEQWKALAKANGIDDPEKLRVGQKLRIPKDRRS